MDVMAAILSLMHTFISSGFRQTLETLHGNLLPTLVKIVKHCFVVKCYLLLSYIICCMILYKVNYMMLYDITICYHYMM